MRLTRERLWLLAAAAVMIGVDLGRRVLFSNDEARFPLIAQGILAGGPWLVPQLDGAAYLHKPALVAWLIALVSLPAGHVSQLTAVLPVALAGLGLVFIVHALGLELFGGVAGFLAALVALTTQGVVQFARIPVPDMVLVASIAGSVWMLVRMTRGDRWAWIGFYGLVGLAFWAKGPAGLMPLAVALGWTLLDRRPDKWRRLRLPQGGLLLGAIVVPWWIGGLLADSARLRGAVVADQLLWYLPQTLSPQPVRHALGIALPWTVIVPFAIIRAVRAARADDSARDGLTLVLVWAGLTLLLVGISYQQRFRYYLPLVPPLALLVGWWLAEMIATRRRAGQAFAFAWAVSAVGLLAAYHVEVGRQNAAYDYPRLGSTLKLALGDPDPVATWGIHHLPLAFYLGRPVSKIADESELRRVVAAPPRGVVVVRDAALARVPDREGLVVLDHERFGGHDIFIVSRRM